MRRHSKLINIFFVLAFAIIVMISGGCGINADGKTEPVEPQFPFSSFQDIPGVTEEEIKAIEALRDRYDHFVYGMMISTEAFLKENGEGGGYTPLFCEWLTELFGIPFQMEIYALNELIPHLNDGEIDFAGNVRATSVRAAEEYERIYYITDTIMERQYKRIRLAGSRNIQQISIERPLRYAFLEGYTTVSTVALIMRSGSYEAVWVKDFAEAYDALKNGEADAFVGPSAVEAGFITYGNVYSEDFFPLIFSPVSMATVKHELRPIISVVNKALQNGARSYLSYLYNQGYRDYMRYKLFMLLSDEERVYIDNHPDIPVVASYNNYPDCFYNTREKEWQGIFFDLMKEVSLLTGLSFNLVHDENAEWPVTYEKIKNREAALSASLPWTREREEFFIWSKTALLPDHYALLSQSDYPNITIPEILNTKVGMGGDTAVMFRQWFPTHTNIVEYESMNDAISALQRGEVDMALATERRLLLLTHYLELPGYKVNIILDQPIETLFGYNKNEAILCSIIDKALRIINTNVIFDQWMHRTYDYRAKVAEARLPWLISATATTLIMFAFIVIFLYRRRNLQKLKEADERAQILFDTAPFASCMFDKNGNTLDCNQEVINMFGLPNREFYLNRYRELAPEYQPCGTLSKEMAEEHDRLAFEKGYHRFEWLHKKLNGEPLPTEMILVRVKYKGEYTLAAYIRDLTEQKAAEELTRIVLEKTSILTAILDATPDLVFCKDLNLRYIEINKAMETLFNTYRSDIVGKTDAEAMWDPPDLMAEYNALDRKIINEEQTVIVEEYIQGFDGKRSLFETIKTPLIQDGKVTGLVGISRDITERKEMAQLAKQQAEAEAANKAKSSFLAAMSHEMRTPMNAILGIAEIQLQNEELPPDLKNALHIVYNSGYSLLGVLNNLLDLSKIESGKLELINERYETAGMINDTVNLNVTRIGSKPIEFKLCVDEDMPLELIGDELRVKQVMNNLLSNAIKYTNSGEVRLSFTAKIEDEDAPNVTLTITVSDTGQGMTEMQVQKMFDAYSRFNMKENRFVEGTGLGMNIVQQLMQKMNGEIKVDSVLGKGTKVTVYLTQGYVNSARLGSEMAEDLMNFRLTNTSRMKKAQITREYMPYGKVLVVDDLETNLYVARGFLFPYGLTIDTALSGMEAIKKIENGNVYDVVYMDHLMPEMDGIKAAKIMREKGYANPIVALTANAVSGRAEFFMENGFDGFISKPINIRELNASLNKFVRDRQPPEAVEAARAAYGGGAVIINAVMQVKPELVKVFTRDAEKAIAILQEYEERNSYGSDDLQMYIINVHALHSALANIGETKLSGFARELEDAGKEKRIDFISEKTFVFLGELRSVVDKLKSYEGGNDAGDVSDEDMEYLRKMLLIIKKSCAVLDKKAAKSALKELKQKSWPHVYGELLDTIAEHLLHGNFDEVKASCDVYLFDGK